MSRTLTYVRPHIRSLPRRASDEVDMLFVLIAELKAKREAEAERAVQANFGSIDVAELGEEQ
jgi:hypothetical protein